ncbi:hypothetical protein [Telmatospirillum sp.]|uniref:hypothetical protein n=1 Tax=Telmatospirillum sp. TaxID=2079197 RepID=UPI00284E9ACC|nr:hypothetical protein [Telmatospirillum sp.]MDR3440978.1 hypothetical protein [Telmatospirillum sp.]
MAHIISAKDYFDVPCGSDEDLIVDVKPVSIHDFIEPDFEQSGRVTMRRACLANDQHASAPESQVDRLISDLMDIIVKAASVDGEVPDPESNEAVAEVVALSMMQALLQEQVCSSY